MKKIEVNVQGMTCSSCEVLLERKMLKVWGVKSVDVSRSKERAVISCEDHVTVGNLQAAVAKKGYTLIPMGENHDGSKATFLIQDKNRLSEIGAIAVLMLGIYLFVKFLGLIPETFGVTENMSYGFIFVLGLVAATSTCLAVSGGLLLVLSNKFNESHPHLNSKQKFKPHIFFNIGRVASYTLLGGVIGALGSFVSISPALTGLITILASIVMVIMGLQLLGIFPWLNKFQLKMPKFIAHKIYDASHTQKETVTAKSSFAFGAATFFLPCGFTQALQLYVLSLGNFSAGAMTMLAFSLGTLPSLLGIGALSSFSKGQAKKYFTTFSAILVVALGLMSIPSGLTLTGIVAPNFAEITGGVSAQPTVPIVGGKQIVDLTVDYLDYFPQKFTIKQGVPVEWRIDARTAVGCAKIISLPKMGIVERLSSTDVTVIEFTPTQKGKMQFSCTMGMAGPGLFEVV